MGSDSEIEVPERMHYTETVITDQPPAYTMNSSTVSNVSVAAAFGTGMNTGVGMGVGVVGMGPHHYGPPMIQSHHNGLVTTVAGGMAVTTFTAKPARITCQSCKAQIVTRCERTATWKTHFFALAFAMVCCLPCCCAVYCIDVCKNAEHYCPECNSYVGSYVI